jgi:hypothetical protein
MVNPTDPSRTGPPAVPPPSERSVAGAAADPAPAEATVVCAARDPLRPHPLSFAQRRIRLAEQLDPGNPVLNLSTVLRLRGTLHVPALRRALREVFKCHEVLRTAFGEAGGEAVQVVRPAPWPGLPVADIATLPATWRARTKRTPPRPPGATAPQRSPRERGSWTSCASAGTRPDSRPTPPADASAHPA